MTIFNSRKSDRHPGLKWIFIAIIVISVLTLLGLELTLCLLHIQEICQGILQVSQKQRYNNRSTCSVPNCASLYWGQRWCLYGEEISTQSTELDETNAVILTGAKQQQSQSKQIKTTKKMKIPVITVEGNIGAGQTTLLQKLEHFYQWQTSLKKQITNQLSISNILW